MLAAYDLKRNPAETQSEFAHGPTSFLAGRGPTTQPVADVPQQVVDAFYRVRFGHLELEFGFARRARCAARRPGNQLEQPLIYLAADVRESGDAPGAYRPVRPTSCHLARLTRKRKYTDACRNRRIRG